MNIEFEQYVETNNHVMNQLMVVINNQNEMIKKSKNEIEDVKKDAVNASVSKTTELINELTEKVTLLEKNYELVANKNKEHEEKIVELEKRVYIFGNNQDDCYTKYKEIAKGRVFKLIGEKGSIKYILFYHSFKLKIHSDVASIISGGKYTKTSIIPDTETNRKKANAIASKWKPDKQYLRKKYNEYFVMYDNNTLVGEKLAAFEQYIEMTNGGRNLEF